MTLMRTSVGKPFDFMEKENEQGYTHLVRLHYIEVGRNSWPMILNSIVQR